MGVNSIQRLSRSEVTSNLDGGFWDRIHDPKIPVMRPLGIWWGIPESSENHFSVPSVDVSFFQDRLIFSVETRSPTQDPALRPFDKSNPVSFAKLWLGRGLEEKASGYWLDGVPVNLPTMMRKFNKLRLSKGIKLIVPEPWKVPL